MLSYYNVSIYVIYTIYLLRNNKNLYFQTRMNQLFTASTSLFHHISTEYDHMCNYTPSTERAMCLTCISEEETRLVLQSHPNHARKYSRGAMCECELQESHTVYTCSVCDEIKREIKFVQSEIIRISTKHAIEVSQTFIVNPSFQRTIEQYAFRCRMLNEFLLHQRVKMADAKQTEEMGEMIDVTDDISAITAVDFEDEFYDNISDSDSDSDEDTMVELVKIQNSNYDYSCTVYSQESSELSLSSCRPTTDHENASEYIWKTYHKYDEDTEESDIRNNTPMTLDELELYDGL